jgi:alkylated DNA repair dioxygenase AlkB
MDLFSTGNTPNLLPYDGTVIYYGKIFPGRASFHYLNRLLQTVEWKNDEAVIFGKHIVTKRKAAWYGDDAYAYTYSNTTKHALPWTPELLELKTTVEEVSGAVFNSCLLNLYHDGSEGMSWHSDDETALGENTVIASVSLGAERRFLLKHKQTKAMVEVLLETGSLLVMKDTTQAHWLHSIPKTTKVTRPRINLTFRTIVG